MKSIDERMEVIGLAGCHLEALTDPASVEVSVVGQKRGEAA